MEHVGPFVFNSIRFALGTAMLLPVIALKKRKSSVEGEEGSPKMPLKYGLFAGLVLFAGASLQQVGLVYTSAGNTGFVTGLYVVLVPVIGLIRGLGCPRGTWVGTFLAVVGMYILTTSGSSRMASGDIIVFAGAIFWAIHIHLISGIVNQFGALKLAVSQFATCSILSTAMALLLEEISVDGILSAAIPILYGGLVSVGIAYTLQVIAQKDTHPAHAAIIMSLEAVFALLGGWLILDETITIGGISGAALMFAAMILSGTWKSDGSGNSRWRRPAIRIYSFRRKMD